MKRHKRLVRKTVFLIGGIALLLSACGNKKNEIEAKIKADFFDQETEIGVLLSKYVEADVYACDIFHDEGYAEKIIDILLSLKDKITALDFYGNDFDYGYLMWILYVIAGDFFGSH